MMRRIGTCILCFVFVSQTLTGCASMTQEQKIELIGAGLGAALGAVAGGLGDPGHAAIGIAIGAVAGALVGGAAGWAVGAYRVKQVKSREQIVAAKDYTPQQGVVTTIDRTEAMPKPVKPGDQLILQAEYTVLAPPENGQIKVWEVRAIFFNGQQLTVLPQRELALSQGTNQVQFPLTLPKDAAEGDYLVMTSVVPVIGNTLGAQSTTPFIVKAAASSPGAVVATTDTTRSAPSATAIAATPTLEQLTLTPRFLHVRDDHARILDGAGANSKLLATAPKCARLEAIEEGGTFGDRWYRVKLETGQDGWVAASAVSPRPCL